MTTPDTRPRVDVNSEAFKAFVLAFLGHFGPYESVQLPERHLRYMADGIEAYIKATSVWRSTKDEPPDDDATVVGRTWINGFWTASGAMPSVSLKCREDRYPSWAPFPNPNDGTTDKDWT
jgi:hypothetical protein